MINLGKVSVETKDQKFLPGQEAVGDPRLSI